MIILYSLLSVNDITTINEVKRYFNLKFKINDLGHMRYFLGMEVSRSSRTLALCSVRKHM